MKKWTFNEEKTLIEYVGTFGIAYVARKLSKSVITIKKKMARMKISVRKKSGYEGIFWNKWDENWIVYGCENGKVVQLGTFSTLNDAKIAIFVHKELNK